MYLLSLFTVLIQNCTGVTKPKNSGTLFSKSKFRTIRNNVLRLPVGIVNGFYIPRFASLLIIGILLPFETWKIFDNTLFCEN